MAENMKIYEQARQVPESAKKEIKGGRLNGYTDINPMWRIKALTEQFGPCGIGWYLDIDRLWIEAASDGQAAAFAEISLYIKYGGEWSKPIKGIGGSKLIDKERSGLYTNDECYKMALTDAISVSCKALGFGADVYWANDKTKYDGRPDTPPQPKQDEQILKCVGCPSTITVAEHDYSVKNYQSPLCRACQSLAKKQTV